MTDPRAASAWASERARPALYMLRGRQTIDRPASSPDYEVLALPATRWRDVRALLELEWPMTDRAWDGLLTRVLPGGLFALRDRRSGHFVGTASAIENSTGSRCYFPAGGQLGYLVVDPVHRGRGLGYGLVGAVVDRLSLAGCRHLWLGVEGVRLPAIRTYLRAGYRPFIHQPDPDALVRQWTRVFDSAGLTPDVAAWPRALPPSDEVA